MYRISIVTVILAVGLAGMFGAGCGNAGEQAAERAAERATERVVEQATGEKVEVSASGEVDVSDLPELLRYPRARVISRVEVSGGEDNGTVWTMETAESPTMVGDWYRAQFTANVWNEVSEMEAGESVLLNYDNPDGTETVAMLAVAEGDKTTISLTHATK